MSLQSATPDNSTDGFWLHFRKYQNDAAAASSTQHPVRIYGATGSLIAAILGANGEGLTYARLYASNGSYVDSSQSWTPYGNNYADGFTMIIDIHVYNNESGKATMDVFINNALLWTLTNTGGYALGMKSANLMHCNTRAGTFSCYSELIVANFDTRNLRVGAYVPSADGTYTDGNGTYADIDETSTDSAAITLGVIGDKQSYAVTRYGNPSIGGILAVAVNGLVSSDGLRDLQAGLRIGGVDYFSADLNLGLSPSATSVVWSAHPGTGGNLPQNPATDIEVIYKAVA